MKCPSPRLLLHQRVDQRREGLADGGVAAHCDPRSSCLNVCFADCLLSGTLAGQVGNSLTEGIGTPQKFSVVQRFRQLSEVLETRTTWPSHSRS